MPFDMLVLDSGEWTLVEELPAEPYYVLIYRDRSVPDNELHLWLPRRDARRTGEYAFRRYWMEGITRWCVELPAGEEGARVGVTSRGSRLRFTAPDGRTVWAALPSPRGLADLTNTELQRLRTGGRLGAFTRI